MDPLNSNAYRSKGYKFLHDIGTSLHYLQCNEESIKMFDKAIELNP